MAAVLLLIGLALLVGCVAPPQPQKNYTKEAPSQPLPASIPPLPFEDNPDPTLCGIPKPYGNDFLGLVTGQLPDGDIAPVVYLYDSHMRREIKGQVYPNTRVKILLSQSNPTLDYYFIETVDLPEIQRGWVPGPFVRLSDGT